MDDLLKLDAWAVSEALARGDVSAETLMRATLEQIGRENGQANAIVSLGDETALMDAARHADASPRRGWLHGIPIAIKDLANAAGYPTSMGSPLFAGRVVDQNDIVVQRMVDAGGLVIGKTNTPEFGLGSHTFNPVFGATENAIMPGKSAGGSSGGAAVALAKHMVCVADGSDMMGSLRNPAGWNGVYGLRPTWGLVPSEPVGDMFLHPLATNGPMARCPRDLALLLATQSGPDPRQPYGRAAFAAEMPLKPAAAGKRIAWLGDWGGAYPTEDGVLPACTTGLERLQSAGHRVEHIGAPFDRDALWESWVNLRSFAVAASLGAAFDDPKLREGLKPEAIWEIEHGRALSAAQIQRASNIRSQWYRAALALFESYDALALPTAQCWPFPIEWDWPKEISGVAMDTYHRWMEVVVPASLIGLPAVAVPLHDQPMGVQLLGRMGDDAGLLALAESWHLHK